MGKFSQAAKRAGLGLAAGLAGGAVLAIKEAQEAEKAGRQTDAALKSTGHQANVTRSQIERLAESLSVKAGIDDEAVQSAENLLLTFTKVRNETGKGNKIFDQATTTIVDMSASLKQDLKSSTIQVGKALNDPIKGVTALQRVGVSFTKSQKEKIKSLVEEGDKLGAQKLILRELKTEFGGSAAANASATDKLKVSFNNLAESAGAALLPTVSKAAAALGRFFDQIRTNEGLGGKVRRVVESIVGFGKAHPGLVKAAAGIAAIGLAIKAIRFTGAITGITQVITVARRLGQTKAGTALADNIVSGVRGVPGRIRSALASARGIVSRLLGGAGTAGGSTLSTNAANTAASGIGPKMSRKRGSFSSAGRSVGRSAGSAAGSATATNAADTAASNVRGTFSEKRGKFRAAGRSLGRMIGRAAGPLAVVLIADEIAKKLGKGSGQPGGAPDTGDKNYLQQLFEGVFARGGFVPGVPTPRDSVPALLSPGEFVLTGHGQQMVEQMAGPGAMGAISRHQAPHFRKGGKAQRFMDGGSVAGLAATAGFRGNKLTTAVAVAGAESGWRENASNRNSNGSIDRGLWQINSIHGRRSTFDPLGNARAAFSISSRGSNWAPWVAYKRGAHRAWIGRAKSAVRAIKLRPDSQRNVKYRTPAAVSHPLLGNILSPLVDDALAGGITAGMEGTGRRGILTSVLEGIVPESGDYATRKTADIPNLKGPSRGGPTGDKAKVIARMQAFGDAITSKGLGYTYGGWHPAGNKSGNPDCSGLVANMLLRGSGKFAQRGTNYTTDTFKNWGAAGAGNLITVGVRGSTGHNAHTMMKVGNKFYESANSRGKAGRRSSWSGSFPIKRHPPGYRAGGVVAPSGIARRLPGRAQVAVQRRGAFDPDSPEFVGWGLRNPRKPKRKRKPASLRRLTRGLAGKPGNRGAARLTRRFAGRVRGRSMTALLKARADIRNRIRALAKHGLTGQERIQVRRLRGALTLIEDEMGRPIGRSLGASDTTQAGLDRSFGRFDNELTVAGIDPESAAGIDRRKGLVSGALSSLGTRRTSLLGALDRAKRSGNAGAVAQVQAELNEVDDQMLGYQAELVNLSKATGDNTDAIKAQTEAMNGLKEELKRQNDFATSVANISSREAVRALGDIISGQIGSTYGPRARSAGAGTLARY